MTYYCTSPGNFTVQLFMYRDCAGIPASASMEVGVFNASNNYLFSATLAKVYEVSIPPLPSSPCLSAPSWVCVREILYEGTLALANSAGGYTLTTQECCRNNAIDNIVNPGSQGMTYFAKVADPATTGCNAGPTFADPPSIAACLGDTFRFDHQAIDSDGDSLVYYLCDAKDAPSNPPSPPQAPPYTSVPYITPYSAGYPMPASPVLSIDSGGQLFAYPAGVGTFVIAVCVDEYRNGQKIGEYRREIALNVVSCSAATVAAHPSPTLLACDTTVYFQNNSTGALTYHWNFGTGNPGDTSDQFEPTFTYSDTGTYTVMLVANPGEVCADTAFAVLTVSLPIYADFGYQGQLCNGSTISFLDSTVAGAAITSWSWTFPGAGTSTLQNPQVVFPTSGAKSVRLIVCDAAGCCDTAVKVLFIAPTPFVPPGSDANICAGNCAQLTIVGASTVLWQPCSWLSACNVPNPLACPPASITYTVTGTSTQGCTDTGTVTLTVGLPPIADFGYQGLLCTGSPVSFLDSSLSGSGPITGWSWTFGDGGTSTQQNPQHSYTSPGNKTVTLIVTDANGCKDTTAKAITVNMTPFMPPGLDVDVCLGGCVQLSASGAATYQWQPCTGLSSCAVANPLACPQLTTTYTVTGTSAQGCQASDQVTVTVWPPPAVTLGSDIVLCTGDSINLSAPSGPFDYLWSTGATTQTITVSSAGDYWVEICLAPNCCERDTVSVSFSQPSVSMSGLASGYFETDPPDTLIGLPPGGTFSGPGITDSIFDPAAAGVGTHVIYYTYTDTNGCSGVDSAVTIVDSATGTVNVANDFVEVRPNPATDLIFIALKPLTGATLQVLDLTGRVMIVTYLAGSSMSVSLCDLPAGTYMVHLRGETINACRLIAKL